MKTIRWGLIGCGNVTEVKSGPAFQKVPGSALVAVMRRNGALAADYAQRHHVPKWYDDADKLLRDPEVDAVYVATPPSTHCEYALRAARAGKPVYVEKPMACTHAECRRMIAACQKAKVPLFVAYYRRALPRFLKVKELVDAGALGEVRFASISLHCAPERDDGNPGRRPWRVKPEIAGAGRFYDLGSHALDILDFILGPIRKVTGQAANQAGLYEPEDIVTAQFTFESGALGTGLWCFSSYTPQWQDLNEIVGSKGKVQFSTYGTEPVRLLTAAGEQQFPLDNPAHVQQPLLQTVMDELQGAGRCPSTGVTAARTNWAMDAILKEWRNS